MANASFLLEILARIYREFPGLAFNSKVSYFVGFGVAPYERRRNHGRNFRKDSAFGISGAPRSCFRRCLLLCLAVLYAHLARVQISEHFSDNF